MGGTKLERFLPKNQHTQRKSLNFGNWVNAEVSKIGDVTGNALAFWFCGCSFRKKIVSGAAAAGAAAAACVLAR